MENITTHMSSEAQIKANRANAQNSSGPKSPEGKAKSSLNAVKTGLTGRTVLLPGDDAAAYDLFRGHINSHRQGINLVLPHVQKSTSGR